MFKKGNSFVMLSVLSVAFGSASAFAAHTEQTKTATIDNNHFISIPNLRPSFEFSAAALWLQAGASNLNYTIYNKALPLQSPSWHERELQPSFDAAFELGLRYAFQNMSGQDIKLTWAHLDSSTSGNTQADGVDFFLGPDFEIGPDASTIRNATGNAKFHYDVVNLDMGQFAHFGEHTNVRFFGGLSTGFLREAVTSTYSGSAEGLFAGPYSMTQYVKSNFSGIGPRVGLHADYDFDCGLGFLGEAAVSGLIGNMRSSTNYMGSSQELLTLYGQAVNYQTISDQHVNQVVPGFDAKVGVNYKYNFKHSVLLTVSAGYQAAVYVNAISQYLPGTLVDGEPISSGGIFVATMNHTLSNYSVQGPFLNFVIQA